VSFIAKEYLSLITNYFHLKKIGRDYPPKCTSPGSILQLCKISSILVDQFRRSCTNLTRQTDRWPNRQTGWFLYNPWKIVWWGYKKSQTEICFNI